MRVRSIWPATRSSTVSVPLPGWEATGASIGVDRLLDSLKRLGKVEARAGMCPVLIAMVEKQYRSTYQRWADQLREAGIPTELYVV